jgi:hypothetical protein
MIVGDGHGVWCVVILNKIVVL